MKNNLSNSLGINFNLNKPSESPHSIRTSKEQTSVIPALQSDFIKQLEKENKKMDKLFVEQYHGGEDFESQFTQNERNLEKAKRKFNNSVVKETKARAFTQEIYCYWKRNVLEERNVPEFDAYVPHYVYSHRGVIPDKIMDVIEKAYGPLNGPLHVEPGSYRWDDSRDWTDEVWKRPGEIK